MRKIIDIVFLILYLQTGWLSIYAVDYISSDYHCIIFHMKLCNCILFPITWNATEVYSYTFLLRIYSLVYDIETMVIYQKYKLTRYRVLCFILDIIFFFFITWNLLNDNKSTIFTATFYVMFQSAWYLKK